MNSNAFENIMEILLELEEDHTVPKNVRSKVSGIKSILSEEGEVEVKKSKIMHHLEEISDDVNLQSYTRTQIWDIISGLENVR